MRYLQSFNTANDVQTALDNDSLGKPYVAYIIQEDRIDWNGLEPAPDPSKEYLTFNIISGGTIIWKTTYYVSRTIDYKINDGEWISITATRDGVSFNVEDGDIVAFKGYNSYYALSTSTFHSFEGTAKFYVKGNIMSLTNGDDFDGITTMPSTYTFSCLFNNCTGLTSAENLQLPATTLKERCYENMFRGCTSLVQAPSILPSITLANYCYQRMFEGCTSLTTAPELPATTLVNGCYSNMFRSCRSLNYIKCLATDISASNCTLSWVNGVAATGTFVKNPNMTSWTTDMNGIPTGWTVIDA